MKKTLSVLLAVLLMATCLSTALISNVAAQEDSIWSKRVALSDGATLSEADCSLTAGKEATFKVTLPAGGYAQFQQKLGDFFGDAAFFNTNYVKVVVGDGKKATYNLSNLYVQLTSSADASKDIVPVDEPNGADPGTDGMTWHLYGCNKVDGNYAYGLNKGSSTVGGAQFTHVANIEAHHLMVSFTKETDGKVTVNQRYGATNANDYANRKMPSTKTLAEIDGEDGVYVRIRNGEDKAQTYTVTVYSSDVSAGYRDGEFVLSDTASTLDSVDYAVENGIGTVKYTTTLSGKGSYIQFDKKLTSLIGSNEKYCVNVKIGNFTAANFWTQLTDDATAASDFAPKKEQNNADPGTDAMTWWFYGHNSNVIIGKGLDSGGYGSTVASASSLSNSGLSIYFKNNSGYVGIKTGNIDSAPDKGYEKYTSTRTMADTGLTDGAYFRVRNGISGATTYTITVTFDATAYTDGSYKFSDKGSKLISTNRVVNGGMIEETATVLLSGKGGYVQLDRLLKDIITKDAIGDSQVKVIIGDGEAKYSTADVYFQLTADKAATTDIVPVNEYASADPGTKGMTWRVKSDGTGLFVHYGSSTGAGQSTFGQLGNTGSPAYHGLPAKFTLDSSNGKVSVSHRHHTATGYAKNAKPSNKTLADIGGENGVYVRIRNGQATSQQYTIVYTYKNVFANTTENGTVTLDKTAALKGETVKATVAPAANYQLKAGSLKYTVDGSKYYPITARVDDSADVFAFTMPEDAVNVTAEFVSVDEGNNALLGAAFNIEEDGTAGDDMRFGSRAYRSAGEKGDLVSCGNYLLRKDSALGAALTDGVALDDAQLEELTNPSEGQFVKRIPTSVLNDRCEDYVDYTVRIVGVADGYADVDYVCVSYANYLDAEGNATTVYSAACVRNYNQLINAAQ